MKKPIGVAILTTTIALLSSCSKPSLFKVSFANYGQQISQSTFLTQFVSCVTQYQLEFYNSEGNLFYKNAEIFACSSLEAEYIDTNKTSSVKVYTQTDASYVIGATALRYDCTSTVNTYIEGDKSILGATNENQPTSSRSQINLYGEVVDGVFYAVNKSYHTYGHVTDTSYTYFNSSCGKYTVDAILTATYIYNYFAYAPTIEYYRNGNILTMKASSTSQTGYEEGIIQYCFGNGVDIKAKVHSENYNNSTPSEAASVKTKYSNQWVEIKVSNTSKKVNRFNYDSYHDENNKTN